MALYLTIKCPRHPRYQGIKIPFCHWVNGQCPQCWQIYDIRHGRDAGTEMVLKARGLSAKVTVK